MDRVKWVILLGPRVFIDLRANGDGSYIFWKCSDPHIRIFFFHLVLNHIRIALNHSKLYNVSIISNELHSHKNDTLRYKCDKTRAIGFLTRVRLQHYTKASTAITRVKKSFIEFHFTLQVAKIEVLHTD